MKNIVIICMLIVSTITTAQTSIIDYNNFKETLISSDPIKTLIDSLPSNIIEEEDATFEFNTKDYLPIGFNPYAKESYSSVEMEIDEEDTPFDYDTKKYLPKGFDPYKGMVIKEKTTL